MPTETRRIPLLRRSDGVELSKEYVVDVDEWGEAWLSPDQIDEIEALRSQLLGAEEAARQAVAPSRRSGFRNRVPGAATPA